LRALRERVTANVKRFLLLVALFPCGACAHVASYERGTLANPSMTTSDIVLPSEAHVRAVHEGAIGGGSAAGGGCGCN
jgi:hypothetical protein